MDILTHTLSGLAVGTVLACFVNKNVRVRWGIIFFSGLGGALPDLDAISMWSKFDMTFGYFLGLDHLGREIYSARFWYSHHAFLHSLCAALLIAAVVGLFFYYTSRHNGKPLNAWRDRGLLLLGFISGYTFHLFEDMVTPASSWGGVRFWFPSTIYSGGTGEVWWWNNYDIFLIVATVVVLNLLFILFGNFFGKFLWTITIGLFVAGFIFCVVQIKTGNFNFNEKDHVHCEQESQEIQCRILGQKVHGRMVKFDQMLKINF